MITSKKVKDFRQSSKKKQTHEQAELTHLFAEIRQPWSNYLIISVTTSENRKYIPIGFMNPENIAQQCCIVRLNQTSTWLG